MKYLVQLRRKFRFFTIPNSNLHDAVIFHNWYLFKSKWLTVSLHYIVKDDTWDPHNHAYNSISLILNGKYIEEIFGHEKRYLRKAWRPWFRPAMQFHRIFLWNKKPVWTLFFQFNYKDRSSAGYMLPDGKFEPTRDYLTRRGRVMWPDKAT